jgi:hypothetical protein
MIASPNEEGLRPVADSFLLSTVRLIGLTLLFIQVKLARAPASCFQRGSTSSAAQSSDRNLNICLADLQVALQRKVWPAPLTNLCALHFQLGYSV